MKNNIKDLYIEDEYKNDLKNPYHAYLSALEDVFDLKIIDSICDVGTRIGNLLYFAKKKYPKIEIAGYEYFEWSKQYAHETVSEYIKILDLSKPFKNYKTFNLVNCTEVGEHIPKESEDVFIDNLCKLSNDILIVSWSNEVVDQHLNPQKKSYIIKKIIKKGFQEWTEKSSDLEFSLKKKIKREAFPWLSKSIMVFKKKKFLESHSKWFVQGCANNNSIKGLKFNYYGVSLQKQLMNLRDKIYLNVANNKPMSILRIGDGELFFINAFPYGSAKPGVRSLIKIDYKDKINFVDCRRSIYKPDIITTEINSLMYGGLYLCLLLEIFYKFFPNFHKSKIQIEWKYNRFLFHIFIFVSKLFRLIFLRVLFFPIFILLRKKLKIKPKKFPILKPFKFNFETIYALVSTRLIFKMFPNKEIMIVAQKEKIAAIEILMTYEAYRSYLGIKEFNSYLGVPKIGAADDEIKILADIKNNVNLYKPKIIIIGIGMAKLYIIPRIKEFTNAMVIDVGVGVDALAGVVSQDRPFFADWINFKSNRINYFDMDLMSDKNNPERDSNKYKKILLDN